MALNDTVSAVPGVTPAFKYWAFISYSHADERWATKLHRAIENFRVPKALVTDGATADGTERPARLFPVFRDRDELPSASSLGDKIEAALKASRNLIVICSPNAARSRWVDEEVRGFKALGREGRVFCVIVDGEPNASGGPGIEARECFPQSVRFRVTPDRQLTTEPAEPIAADARPHKDGSDYTLKLLAGLLDVGFDTLKQREQERRIRRYWIASVVLGALLLVVGGLAVIAYLNSERAQREAKAARAALSEQLATHSQLSLARWPQRSLLLAVAALGVTAEHAEPRVVAAEEALRGALANAGGVPFAGGAEPMTAVALSADGRWLAVAAESGAGAKLWRIGADASGPIDLGSARVIAFSSDSRWLAAAGTDNVPGRLWDLAASSPTVSRELPTASAPMAFSRDGRWLATGGSDRSVRLWRLTDQRSAPVVLPPQSNATTVVAFSPDSRWLATSSWSERGELGAERSIANLWDLSAADPAATGRELAGGRSSTTHFVFSPDSRLLATASAEYVARPFRFDTNVRVFDTTRPDVPAIVLGDHTGPVTALAMSADGKRLASGSKDGSLRVWKLDAANPAAEPIKLPDQDQDVAGLVFSPDHERLFTRSGSGWSAIMPRVPTAAIWNLDAAENPTTRTAGRPDNALLPAVLSEDGRPVAVSAQHLGEDGRTLVLAGGSSLYLLDLADGQSIEHARVLRGHEGAIGAIASSTHAVASIGEDGGARLWPLGYARFGANPQVLPGSISSWMPSRTSARWLLTSDSAGAALWDLSGLVARRVDLVRGEGRMFTAAFSPDERWIAAAGGDGKVRLWRLSAEEPAAAPIVLAGHEGIVRALAFSGDGRWLATGGDDKTVRLWDLQRSDPSQGALRLAAGDLVFHVAIAANRWLVASGVVPLPPTLWDLAARDVAASARPLPEAQGHVVLARDGQWLVSFGVDERPALNQRMNRSRSPQERVALSQQIAAFKRGVVLWDLRAEAPRHRTLDRASDSVVVFGPRGRWLLTSGVDELPRLWSLERPDAAPIALTGHPGHVDNAAFSDDERWLVTSDYEGGSRMWDLQAKDIAGSSRVVSRHEHGTGGLAFSPDGRLLFHAGAVAQLMPLDDGMPGPPVTLPNGKAALSGGRFTRDGRWLVADQHEGYALTLWAVQLDQLVRLACRTAGRDVNADEQRLYRIGTQGRGVCPPATR